MWHQLTGWAETRGLFVFAYHGTGDLAWLPKRGALTPAELERVRALIDRNLRRR
ncbi:YcxB family protein [Streptomyces sp. NPDC044571]|uniref:YcxB family protein n=1 Tax=Streptomyces sp. NPDC044571 TaxID=3155371 RepID=UPI0034037FC8